MTVALILVCYVFLLALAGRLLRGAAWVDRAPRLGVFTWYALSVAALLSAFLTGAVLAVPGATWTADFAMWFHACVLAVRSGYGLSNGLLGVVGLALCLGLAVWQAGGLVAEFVRAGRERRRQAEALALVGRRAEHLDALVVDHPVASAYCLPGRRRQVVLTSAALEALDDEQVRAVLAHERAHLRGRHHLLLGTIRGLERALPFLPVLRDARDEIARLLEILADEAATRHTSRRTIARALVTLASATAPTAALGAGGPAALARVRRLLSPPRPLGARRHLAAALATASLLLPLALAIAPVVAAVATSYCPLDVPPPHPTEELVPHSTMHMSRS